MVATALLLVLLSLAAATDVRHHKIYNWTTYPGIVAALGLNAVGAVVEREETAAPAGDEGPVAEGDDPLRRFWGFVGGQESLAGFAACGGLMLVAFVLFDVGGGDVKLMAMLGAFLGFERGLEALVWTFVLAACVGSIVLIWPVGAVRLIGRVARQMTYALRIGGWADLEPAEREQLQFPMFLAPTALAAFLIVELRPPKFSEARRHDHAPRSSSVPHRGGGAMNHDVIEACMPWSVALAVAAVAAARVVRVSGARLRLGRLRSLGRDQHGAVQSLSFVLTLPAFMMIMLFILQISQVLIGTIVVHYAAFAAARSAIVWIPARLEPFDPQDDPQFATYGPYLRANQMGPTLIDRGAAPGGTRYEIGPGTPKYRQIQAAAALACVSISPSRRTSAGASGLAPSTSTVVQAVYRNLAPLAAVNPQVATRLRNKLAYALANTQVKVQFTHKSDEPPLGHYYIRSALGNDDQAFLFWEVGWQDPVTVTVTHQFALMPGPGRFLSKPTPTASGQPDLLSPKIRRRGGEYVYPITATVTLGNEGEKPVLPKVEQFPGAGT